MHALTNANKSCFVFFEWAQFDPTWIYLRQRAQQLARAFANLGVAVLFVEPPSFGGVDTLEITQFEGNIYRVTPWADDARCTNNCLRQLDQLLPEAVWLVHYPAWLPLLEDWLSPSRRLIYDCMDQWTEFPNAEPNVMMWEAALATNADLVLASAMPLYTQMKLLNPSTAYVSNAVHANDYSEIRPEAADLKEISGPRLVFVGSIEDWVDLDLIHYIAASRPQWSLVMIGPSSIGSSRLPQKENIFWLGRKPYAELANYMPHCDIGLIPFVQTKLTRAVNPLKVHEYIACGLPVVSTFLPDLLLFDDPAIRVTDSYDAFLQALDDLVESDCRAQNASGLHSGTWDDKAQRILQWLDRPDSEEHVQDRDSLDRYIAALAAMSPEQGSEIQEELALAHYVRGDYERVLEHSVRGSSLYVAALIRLNRYDESYNIIRARSRDHNEKLPAMVAALTETTLAAYVFIHNGEPMAALEVLRQDTVLESVHYILLGRALASLGESAQALAAYAQAMEPDPSLFEPLDFVIMGDLCTLSGLYDNAEGFYLQADQLGLKDEVAPKLATLYLTSQLASPDST